MEIRRLPTPNQPPFPEYPSYLFFRRQKNTTNCFNYLFIQQIIRIFAPSIQIKKVMTQLILNIENPAYLPEP